MLNASRNYTLDAIDDGKPGVINSIMKYHATEKFRTVINDSMDVLGGSAIIRGKQPFSSCLFCFTYFNNS